MCVSRINSIKYEKMAQIAWSDKHTGNLYTLTKNESRPIPADSPLAVNPNCVQTSVCVCVHPNLKAGYQMNEWACTPGGPVAQQK